MDGERGEGRAVLDRDWRLDGQLLAPQGASIQRIERTMLHSIKQMSPPTLGEK
jgi:hypothetical protein